MQYAIIQKNTVVNVVLWDGEEGAPVAGQEDWKPFSERTWPSAKIVPIPDGTDVVIGTKYVSDAFVTPTAPSTVNVVPQRVTMRQARLALLAAGKYQAVQDVIGAVPGDEGIAARIEWEFASDVERDSAIVKMLASALKLKAAALDDLFTNAAGL